MDCNERSNTSAIGILDREEKEEMVEKVLEEIMIENVANLAKDIRFLHIQEAE